MPSLALAALLLTHTLDLRLVGPAQHLYGISTRFAGDVNADGYGDVLVYGLSQSSGMAGVVFVQSGVDGARIHRFDGLGNSLISGVPMDAAGDVNADGYDDVIVGNAGLSIARVHSGRDGGVLFQLTGQSPGDGFGGSVRGTGDVNGDGHADWIIGSISASPGYATVFSGADGSVLHHFVGSAQGDQFGFSACAIGDVDGDGHIDFAVRAVGDGRDVYNPGYPPFVPPFWTDDGAGTVTVYSGLTGSELYAVLGRSEYDAFGYSIDALGDVDSDGYGDFVVGTGSFEFTGFPGHARVVSGHTGTTLRTPLRNSTSSYQRVEVSGAGDVDHDGVPDVLAGASQSTGAPDAFVFSGASGVPLFRYAARSYPSVGRITVAGGKDIDQDGTPDFIIGVFQTAYGTGYADVFVSP